MANTIIVLKHSTDTGNIPSDLASGELAINTYDGKLFYRGGSGNTIQTIEKYDGPGGTDGDVQFNDSGTLNGDSGLNYNKTTDILTVVGGVITGGVNVAPTISSAYNHSNAAFDWANAAYNAANTAGGGADTYARNTANASFIHANASFDAANTNATTITVLQGINTTQNTNITIANNTAEAAFSQANTNASSITALQAVNVTQNTNISNLEAVNATQNANITTANNTAKAGFAQANTNAVDITALQGVNTTQNTNITIANNTAEAAFAHANTGNNTADAAFAQANTNASSITALQAVNVTQNTSISNLEGVNTTQNTNITTAQNTATAAFIKANTPSHVANSAAIYANGAFAVANNNNGINTTQNTNITTANNTAIAAFNHANSAFAWANAAYDYANTSITTSGGTISGSLNVTSNVWIGGNLIVAGSQTVVDSTIVTVADNIITLNAAVDQASAPVLNAGIEIDRGSSDNVAILWNETSDKWTFTNDGTNYLAIADAAINDTQNTSISQLQAVEATQNTNITTAQNTATAAFIKANTPSHVANSAAIYANGAFTAANNNTGINTTQNTNITTAQNTGDAAFAQANTNATNITVLQGVDTTQNTNISFAYNHANSAFGWANAAYDAANTAGGADQYARDTANAAFDAANTAQNSADAAFLVANNNAGINATQNTSIDTLNSVNFIAVPDPVINANVSSFGGNNAVWNEQTVDLSPYAGATLRVVWVYSKGGSFTGDIQLDDVYINGTTYDFETDGDGFETSLAGETAYDDVSWSSVVNGGAAARWNRDSGGTPSSSTGLAEDHTLGTTSGSYLYVETSGGSTGDNSWLRSPEITLNSNPGYLSFWEARYGATMGNVTVYLIGTSPSLESAKANIAWNHANAAFAAANTAGGATLGDVLALSIALG